MSSINQILNSALMESSTNLEEAIGPVKPNDYLGRAIRFGKFEVKKTPAIVAGATTAGATALGGLGIMKMNADEEQAVKQNKQDSAAVDSKFKDVMAARAAAAAAKPPKSFVQKYGDQAKAMWDKAVTDGTASWDKFNVANPNAGKYGAAGLVALGAGIGAVALAKKLRAKKAAVKK
jgi:hypothetical protein